MNPALPDAPSGFASDRQKAKVLTFFCVLGLAGFLINLLAGFALWAHHQSNQITVPTYDALILEMGRRTPDGMKTLTTDLFEKWSACATAQSGWRQVTTHALITASVIGAALFAVCAVLAYQLYRRLTSLHTEWSAPQPPDVIDE